MILEGGEEVDLTEPVAEQVTTHATPTLVTQHKRKRGMGRHTLGFLALFSILPLGLYTTVSFSHSVLLPLQIIDSIGESKARALGIGIAISSNVGLIIGALSGFLSDRMRSRFGRRIPFIVLGSVIYLATFVVRSRIMSRGYKALVLNGFLLCVEDSGYSMAMTCYLGLLADTFEHKEIGFVTGMQSLIQIIGNLLGVSLLGFLYRTRVPEWLVLLCFPILIIICTIMFVTVHKENEENYCSTFEYVPNSEDIPDSDRLLSLYDDRPGLLPKLKRGLRGLLIVLIHFGIHFTYRSFTIIFISRACFSLALGFFQNFTLYYLHDKFGEVITFFGNTNVITSAQQAQAIYYLGMYLTSMVSVLAVGYVTDKVGARIVIFICGITLAFVFGFLTFIDNFTFLWVTSFIVGPAVGSFFASDLGLLNDVIKNGHSHATSVAVFNFAQTVPQTLSSPLGGNIIEVGEKFSSVPHVGYNVMFGMGTILYAISAAIIWFVKTSPAESSTNTPNEDQITTEYGEKIRLV